MVLVSTVVVLSLLAFGLASPAIATDSADRESTTEAVGPGGTAQVTVSVDLDEAQSFTIAESIDGPIGSLSIVDDGGASDVEVDESAGEVVATYDDEDAATLVYRITADGSADTGDTLDIDGTVDGDTTMSIGNTTIDVTDDAGVAVWIDEPPSTAVTGETERPTIVVENLDADATAMPVALVVDGVTQEETVISIDGFEQQTLTLEWTPSLDDVGMVSLAVATDTHERSYQVSVEQAATFEVSELTAPERVEQFEPFDASVEVVNTGERAGTQTINLALADGAHLAAAEVTLDPGESTVVPFEGLTFDEGSWDDVFTLVASSDDDETDRPIFVENASADLSLADQAIGVTTNGEPAAFLEDIVADEGWAIAMVDSTDAVVGVTPVDTALRGDQATIELAPAVEAGAYEAVIVANGSDVVIGETLPTDAEVLATDTGLLVEASLEASSFRAEDTVETVFVDGVAFDSGTQTSRAYAVGVYRALPNGSVELIGQSSLHDSSADWLAIDLDEPIASPGTHDLVITLHETRFGQLDAPYRSVRGETVEPIRENITLSIDEVPSFAITDLELPETVEHGGYLTAAVTVTNEGSVGGTQSVWLEADGAVDTVAVTLEPGESTTVSLTVPVRSQPGTTVDVAVDAGISTEHRSVEVVERDELPSTAGSPVPAIGVTATAVAVLGLSVLLWRRHASAG